MLHSLKLPYWLYYKPENPGFIKTRVRQFLLFAQDLFYKKKKIKYIDIVKCSKLNVEFGFISRLTFNTAEMYWQHHNKKCSIKQLKIKRINRFCDIEVQTGKYKCLVLYFPCWEPDPRRKWRWLWVWTFHRENNSIKYRRIF